MICIVFLTELSVSFLGGLNKNIQIQGMIIYYMIIYTEHNTYIKNGAEITYFLGKFLSSSVVVNC